MCNCFLGNIWQQVLPWQHFFMFLGPKNRFWGSLHSKPLHGLELITLTTITGTPLPWQHFFLFLGLISWTYIFMGSLLSIPLHKLELISFSATPGNKCCHGSTLCFLNLKIFLWVLCIPNPCTHWS